MKGRGNRLPITIAVHSKPSDFWEAETEEDGSFVVTGPSGRKGSINFSSVAGFDSFLEVPTIFFPFFKVNGDFLRFDSVPPGVYDAVEVHYVRKETQAQMGER